MKKKSEDFYLKKVHLKGYKSIKDVEVELENGLNIIIGKNASGKTNFVTFLNDLLNENFKDLPSFYSKLHYKNETIVELSKEKRKRDTLREDVLAKIDNNVLMKINNEIIKKPFYIEMVNRFMIERCYLVNYGLPKEQFIVDLPFQFQIDLQGFSLELENSLTKQSSLLQFQLLLEIYANCTLTKTNNNFKNEIDYSLKETFKVVDKFKDNLKKYSPILDVRFSDNYNMFENIKDKTITISNLFLEYKIEDNWLPFSYLSDGTKRLLYIITEFSYTHSHRKEVDPNNEVNFLILLEEPELGIHPHQLINLMKFINEMSRDKQIIITTHSPLVLDILEKDELNKIIIAYTENDNKGTKLRHLNRNEITKAQMYMEEDYLSDYWKYSDLEK